MNIEVSINNIKIKLSGSGFSSIKETTENLISHCVEEAIKAYKESHLIDISLKEEPIK